jgi:hypothetical protein
LRFNKERQIYTSKIGENLPRGVEISPSGKKPMGTIISLKVFPRIQFFWGKNSPMGGSEIGSI